MNPSARWPCSNFPRLTMEVPNSARELPREPLLPDQPLSLPVCLSKVSLQLVHVLPHLHGPLSHIPRGSLLITETLVCINTHMHLTGCSLMSDSILLSNMIVGARKEANTTVA